ncbi:MAG: aldolase/citrate lyase family protein [Acidobacteriota bacterium]
MSPPIVATNRVKKALREGRSVVGTMVVEFRQPSIMQLLANAGFDFVIIDNEHGPFNIETIADLSRSAVQHGLTPIVRVPDWSYPHIAQPLDSGAQGVMIPRIAEAQQVRDVLEMMKYPPQGRRGCALARGHTSFQVGPVSEAMAAVNQETLLIIQLETRQAVDNLDEIAAVEGLDVLLVGPNDLSISLGVPGQMEDAGFTRIVQRVVDTCRDRKVFPAIHVNDVNMAVRWVGRGMQMISFSSELGFVMKAGSEARKTIQESFKG